MKHASEWKPPWSVAERSCNTRHNVSDVTRLLNAAEQGDPRAAEELLPLVYEELRRLAAARMANERPGQTLQPTALVHEAWIRLLGADGEQLSWNSRGHFICAAAEAMRRILIERARRKERPKHGGGLERMDLDDIDLAVNAPADQLVLIDEALEKLRQIEPKGAKLIKLRFFCGLSNLEAAKLSGNRSNAAWP
jgi:RNA polymerase sigma factor (TIGR02999 family)